MATLERAKYRRDLMLVLLFAMVGVGLAVIVTRIEAEPPRADGCRYSASQTHQAEERIVMPNGQPAVVRQDVEVTLYVCESRI